MPVHHRHHRHHTQIVDVRVREGPPTPSSVDQPVRRVRQVQRRPRVRDAPTPARSPADREYSRSAAVTRRVAGSRSVTISIGDSTVTTDAPDRPHSCPHRCTTAPGRARRCAPTTAARQGRCTATSPTGSCPPDCPGRRNPVTSSRSSSPSTVTRGQFQEHREALQLRRDRQTPAARAAAHPRSTRSAASHPATVQQEIVQLLKRRSRSSSRGRSAIREEVPFSESEDDRPRSKTLRHVPNQQRSHPDTASCANTLDITMSIFCASDAFPRMYA
jgi:hypothetical protein